MGENSYSRDLTASAFPKQGDGTTGRERASNMAFIAWDMLGLTRFILAFIVLQFHISAHLGRNYFNAIFAALGGKAAVVGFLVVSGFSIHAALTRSPKNFVFRRFIRIYPAYLFSIAFTFAVQNIIARYGIGQNSDLTDGIGVYGCNLILLQMYACKAVFYDGPVWSLSLEFSYYLLVFFYLKRSGFGKYILGTLSAALFCVPDGYFEGPLYHLITHVSAIKFFWPFLFGFLLYEDRRFVFSVALCCISCLLFQISHFRAELLGPLTVAFSFAMVELAKGRISKGCPFCGYLGDMSYPLYLIHFPIVMVLREYSDFGISTLATLLAIFASVIVLEGVEKPFRRILHKLGSQRV